ncbi:MAG: S-layer homology domain-containing protein, partial [Acidobacteriota bacterium]
DHSLWASSAAFESESSLTPFATDLLGYKWRAGAGGSSYMAAPVNLPGGASVTSLRLYYYDADAVGQVSGYFGYWGGTATVPLSWGTDGAHSGEANASGYGAADVAFTHTVANTDRAYFAQVYLGSSSNSIRFKGVRLTYRLQVSTAPGVATFADVPTSHMFFQYVEALVASGITAGCGGGNYCPDSPVTRGQMAVFLSKALGLHWQ